MTINVRNARFPVWTRLNAPSTQKPYWHEEEDGTRHHLLDVLAGMDGDDAAAIEEMHAEAIRGLVAAALTARRNGDGALARRLATAAGQLAGETVGLWRSYANGT